MLRSPEGRQSEVFQQCQGGQILYCGAVKSRDEKSNPKCVSAPCPVPSGNGGQGEQEHPSPARGRVEGESCPNQHYLHKNLLIF